MGASKAFNMVGGGSGGIRLEHITITTPPTKTSYYAGESFDAAGMVVTAAYSNGATLIVGGYTVTPETLALNDESVTISYTEAGVTKTATQAVSVTRRRVTIPTYSGSLTYNGTEQTPTFNNDPGALATKGGNTSATNAGSNYTTTFTLKDTGLYEWADGSTGVKSVGWSITKKAPTISVSPGSVTLNSSALTASAAVTTDSDGALGASSSDSSVATASISGTAVTISHVNKTTGTAIITIGQAESTNYLSGSATISVTAQFVSIYGVEWDGTSTTKWTRTDAAAGFTDPVPYVAGASSYGSPFDNLQPWAGMVKSERTGGTMVAIPKFYYKLTQNGAGLKIQIADGPVDGFSVSPAHMDRGDGKGERDVVYIGRYHCGTAYKSVTGQTPKNNETRATFRTQCHNLGSTIWLAGWLMRFTLWLLYLVEFADWNSQATIGKGCGNNSSVQAMGYTDSMPYHTGTTQSSRNTFGLGTQYRHIEGLWDNVTDWTDECRNSSTGLMIMLNPADSSDTSGGVSVGTPTNGYPSAFSVKTDAGFPMIIPTAASGSDSTYSCDYWNFSAGNPCVSAGGGYGQSANYGLFFWYNSTATNKSAGRGGRLQELP